ncbi:hypothetical protein [Bacillus sp. FJAT-29937]|uniref:hypothetical protein n=1 Tax=Bacillus sp. FJAT-29937 TaxID=1720553 RepID=UPI0008317032|nr:hypothetical protein [Bacillus sp. FJAT-29937]
MKNIYVVEHKSLAERIRNNNMQKVALEKAKEEKRQRNLVIKNRLYTLSVGLLTSAFMVGIVLLASLMDG